MTPFNLNLIRIIIWHKIKQFCSLVYEFGDRMSHHKLFIMAGGLSFNVLLYIIPLVLILTSFINIFIDPDVLVETIHKALNNYLPDSDSYSILISQILSEIESLNSGSKLAGTIGFVVLLWISSTVVSCLNTTISLIYNFEQPTYLLTKLKDISTTLILTILIIIYGFLQPLSSLAEYRIIEIFPSEISSFLVKFYVRSTSIFVSIVFFSYIYWVIPSSKNKINNIIPIWSTVIAVVFIEIARILFSWYISHTTNYSRFYGAYAVIVTLAIWLLYSCFIVLFSAELSKFIWDKRKIVVKEIDTIVEPVKRKISNKKRIKSKVSSK